MRPAEKTCKEQLCGFSESANFLRKGFDKYLKLIWEILLFWADQALKVFSKCIKWNNAKADDENLEMTLLYEVRQLCKKPRQSNQI